MAGKKQSAKPVEITTGGVTRRLTSGGKWETAGNAAGGSTGKSAGGAPVPVAVTTGGETRAIPLPGQGSTNAPAARVLGPDPAGNSYGTAGRSTARNVGPDPAGNSYAERGNAYENAKNQRKKRASQLEAERAQREEAYRQGLITQQEKRSQDRKGAAETRKTQRHLEQIEAQEKQSQTWNREADLRRVQQEYIQRQQDPEARKTGWKSAIRTEEGTIREELARTEETIQGLRNAQKALQEQARALMSRVTGRRGGTAEMTQWSLQARQLEQQAAALEDNIRQAQTEQERLQEEQSWKTYTEYERLRNHKDFAQKSQYQTTRTGEAKLSPWAGVVTDTGYGDILYDYINGSKQAQEIQEARDVNAGTTHRHLKNLPKETVALFNYLYAQDEAQGDQEHNRAYEYIDQAVKKQYTGIEALSYGVMQGTGIASMAATAGSALSGGNEQSREWYGQFLQDAAGAAQEHPGAYYTGSTAGNLALMYAVGGAAGAGASALGLSAGALSTQMATGALSFAGATAVQNAGAAATGMISGGQYLKGITESGIQGMAGNLAGGLVGSGIAKTLKDAKLMTPFLEFVRVTASSMTDATVNQAAGYLMAEEKPSDEEIISGLATAFGFSVLTGAMRSYQTTQAQKANMQSAIQTIEQGYEELCRGTGNMTAEGRTQRAQMILKQTQGLRESLNSKYIAGQQKTVNQLNGALDLIESELQKYLGHSTAAAQGARMMGGAGAPGSQGTSAALLKTETAQGLQQALRQGLTQKAAAEPSRGTQILLPRAGEAPRKVLLPTAEQGMSVLPQGEETASRPIQAGRGTVIQRPYTGKTPRNLESGAAREQVSIPPKALAQAQAQIEEAQASGKFKVTLTNLLETVFGKTRSVEVQGVVYENEPYLVQLGKKLVGKVVSDPNLSAEKTALMGQLDQVVASAKYVGSGEYHKAEAQRSKSSVIRYDYFENDVKIDGKPYLVSFDVEIRPDVNNFRTYKILDEITLKPVKNEDSSSPSERSLVGPVPTAKQSRGEELSPSSSIPQEGENIKSGTQILLPRAGEAPRKVLLPTAEQGMRVLPQGRQESTAPPRGEEVDGRERTEYNGSTMSAKEGEASGAQRTGENELYHGDRGRATDPSTRGQAGSLATGRPRSAADRSREALDRQNYGRNLRLERIDSKTLGVERGTEEPTLQVLPEEAWDESLRQTAARVEQETGKRVTMVLGQIQIYNQNGGISRVRGVNTGEQIILQADNLRVSVEQIADHEIFHDYEENTPGLARAVEEAIVARWDREEFNRALGRYAQGLRGVVEVPEGRTLEETEEAMDEVKKELLANAYAGIDAFGTDTKKYQETVKKTLEERGILRPSRETEAATRRKDGPPEKYSIEEIEGEKGPYGLGVILDTTLFDGVSPRNWGKVLSQYVYEHLAGAELTMYGKDGTEETVYLAKKSDRVQKDGAKNSHRVIDKLAGYRGDQVRAKAIVQLDEVLATAGNERTTGEHRHKWLDENGWTLRTAYLQDRDGNIYEATLNIAEGRDRRILYEISRVHRVDTKRNTGEHTVTGESQRSRYQELRTGGTQSDVSTASIAETGTGVKASKGILLPTAEEGTRVLPTAEEDLERQAAAKKPRERYSIEETTDNKPFVEVEENILAGVPEKDWVRTVKENLRKKFPNGITVGNSEIQIDYQSMQEMTFSKYMQWLYRHDQETRADKLRATNYADEIVLAAVDWINEGLHHPRKDNIADFARGTVLLRVGKNDYKADVVVGTRKNGKMLLYDILNLSKTAFTKKETGAAIAENPSPGTNRSTAPISSADSIPERGRKIKSGTATTSQTTGILLPTAEEGTRVLPTAEEDLERQAAAKKPRERYSLEDGPEEPLYTEDHEGRSIRPEQAARLSGTAVTDEEGRPLALYHFTPEMKFTRFEKGDTGFHFGTQAQAMERKAKLEAAQGRMFRVYLNIQNPIRARLDIGCWQASHAGLYLWTAGYLTDEEWAEIKSLDREGYDSPAAVRLREMLEEKGYDGLVYPNGIEGDGDSYMALRDDQIVQTEIRNVGEPLKAELPTAKEEEVAHGREMDHRRIRGWEPVENFGKRTGKGQGSGGVSETGSAPAGVGIYAGRSGRHVYTEDPRGQGLASPGKILLPTAEEGTRVLPTAEEDLERREMARKPREKYSLEDGEETGLKSWDEIQQEARKRLEKPRKEKPVRQTQRKKPAEQKKSAPVTAKKELRQSMMKLFHIPAGMRKELGAYTDRLAERMLEQGTLSQEDKNAFFDKLYESGVVEVQAEEYYQAARGELAGRKIYIPERVKEAYGGKEAWNAVRKRAFAAGIWLTNNENDNGIGQAAAALEETLPGLMRPGETDEQMMLERMIQLAEEGKSESMTLSEYAATLAGQESVTEDEVLDGIERQMEWMLQTFAEKARLEIRLRDRTEMKMAQEQLQRQREREMLRRAEERQKRKEQLEQQRQRKQLQEMQQKTLRALQWLGKNRHKAPEELKDAWDEALGDIDLYAVGAAQETRWSGKYGATWENLAEMYQQAKENDPNFLPSKDLERIVARLNKQKIAEMDIGALEDLYKAAVGLRTEYSNRNKVIGDEMDRQFAEVYTQSKKELEEDCRRRKRAGRIDPQLSAINVIEKMTGWNENATFYAMGKQLEKGERDIRAYTVKAQRLLQEYIKEHKDWIKKADGQGKDAIWYEIEVPELLELRMGDKPLLGKTVKVAMTPAQKVQMYLESKSYDNLRHMAGGRTFADRDLYSKGKRKEAYDQGRTIRLAPETVKALVADLTEEEMALAQILEAYYNEYAKGEINRVANALYGYDKATAGYYAPIYTNRNYVKGELGVYEATAEGVGNLKSRIYSKNPSYNIGAFDAFEKHVEQTARFVGMAIPARNWQTLLNWSGGGSSMRDVISHSWEKGVAYLEDLINALQGGSTAESGGKPAEIADKLFSNYIGAVFGLNPSIVLKQLGSIPLAGAWLGARSLPTPGQIHGADPALIAQYTQELAWRTLGYATPETKQLKENPGPMQSNKALNTIAGGGAITAMDGWAAKTLWPWAVNKARRENPELEEGTQEQIQRGESPLYQKAAELFNEAVSRSQSTSDKMHQGTLRKSKNVVSRSFTMFKSDDAQNYNAAAQKAGEAAYYRRIGDKKKQREKERELGAAVLAMLVNGLWTQVVGLIINLITTQGKAYQDEDGKLTAESVLVEVARGMLGGLAGITAGGEELAGMIGSILIEDEKWYGIDLPGMEQVSDLAQAMVEDGGNVVELLTDVKDVAQNGGDVKEYLRRNAGDLTGQIKEAAARFATYLPGLPVKNLEKYLLGAVRWISPEAAAAYEDLLATADKGRLEGLEGPALETRIEDLLENRRIPAEEETAAALAALYEKGWTGAIPPDTPDSIRDGEEARKLNAYEKQVYDQVWSESIGQGISELTASQAYIQAEEEVQEKMLKHLYEYATERAKEALLEGYEKKSSIREAERILAAGASVAEWAAWQGESESLAPEAGKRSASDRQKYELLLKKHYSDEVKEALAGSLMGTEMETESGNPSAYAKMLEARKTGLGMDEYLELRLSGAIDEYLEAAEAGVDPETAQELAQALESLAPEKEKNSVSPVQKWRAAIDAAETEEKQKKALQAVMEEEAWAKYQIADRFGIAPRAYVRLKELLPAYDADGNGSYKNAEIQAAIDAMGGSGALIAPWEAERRKGEIYLTREEKAVLWQLYTGSRSAKNNPYSTSIGQQVLEAKAAAR